MEKLPPPPPYEANQPNNAWGSDHKMLPTSTTIGKHETLTYEIHYKTWNIAMRIVDAQTKQQLYTLTSGGAIGQDTQVTDSANRVIATGYASHWKTGVKMQMHETGGHTIPGSFETHTDKMLGFGSPSFVSPAFGGQKMTWKNKALSTKIHYTLIDERGIALAQFQSAGMKWKTVGTLQIMVGEAGGMIGEPQIAEIVSTVLTLMYRKLVANNVAAIS